MTKLPKGLSKSDLLKLLAEMPDEETYICIKCDEEIQSEKVRKRCSKCKGKLIIKGKNGEPVKEDHSFLAPIRTDKSNRRRVNPETGIEEGIYTRSETVIANTKPFDAGNLYKNDTEEWDKKVKFNRTPRREGRDNKVVVQCEGCSQTFKVHPMFTSSVDGTKKTFFCDRCITKKAKR